MLRGHDRWDCSWTIGLRTISLSTTIVGTQRQFLVGEPEHPELQLIAETASPIETLEGCRAFELCWKRYAAYLVTEELIGSNSVAGNGDEKYTGKMLRVYTKSHFLNHLQRDTGGHVDPIQHYKLICLNHLIDVAAYAPPQVRFISRDEGVLSRTRSWCNRLVSPTESSRCDTMISMSGHYVSKQLSDHDCEGERFGTEGFPIRCNDTPVFELVHSNGKSIHICEYHIQFYWNAWPPFREAVRDIWLSAGQRRV